MGRRIAVLAVIGATFAALAAGGFGLLGTAAAQPSNQGTIKIFDGDKELPANDPKAGCEFTVRGIGFEANETGIVVTIEGQGGENVAGTGSFAQTVNADANGDFTTSPISLPNGMYKANANDGEGGGDKNKVFRVECVPVTPTTQAPPTTKAPVTAPPVTAPRVQAPAAPSAVAAVPRVTG